jgi:hypothetical protein
MLRQPNRADRKEARSDPYFEFGSFGCTGCHHKNLLRPDEKTERMVGGRLAIVQGGEGEMRLVLLTPPIKRIRKLNKRREALWRPTKAFCFARAPILVNNHGVSNFPELIRQYVHDGNRSTLVGQFSSAFRARRDRLNDIVAEELVNVYTRLRREAKHSDFAKTYVDTMPYSPRSPAPSRQSSYMKTVKRAIVGRC